MRELVIAAISVASVALLSPPVLLADLLPKHADIDDVTIGFRPQCGDPAQQLTLGDMDIDLKNLGASAQLDVQFDVEDPASDSPIWNCMKLHYLQTIWYDDCPAKIGGVAPPRPVVDPPKGGWDYMYHDGAARQNPNMNMPNYGWFIDDQPWYYNGTGEGAQFTDSELYKMNDVPSYCSAPGWTGFSTYLLAEATQTCADDPLCLKENELLLLAGFDWTISASDIQITDTFTAPSPFDVTDITTSLGNANFEGWSVFDSKIICCIPEPGSALLLLAGVVALRRRAA